MAASTTLTRSKRNIQPPTMYTPSRAEVVMNYKLNEKKALDKQIQATKREQNVDIELKRGTLVLTFTSGAYLIYKAAIYDFYEKSTDRTYHKTTKSSKTSKGSIEKAIVEESLSILDKNSNDKIQHFRINLFNTTSRISVNGRLYRNFITYDLPQIIRASNLSEVDELNAKILQMYESRSNKIPTTTKDGVACNIMDNNISNTLAINAINERDETVNNQESDNTDQVENVENNLACPICGKIVHNDSIECNTCDMWIHKNCTEMPDSLYKTYEDDPTQIYTCRLCKNLEDNVDIGCENDNYRSFVTLEPESDREGTLPTDDNSNTIEREVNASSQQEISEETTSAKAIMESNSIDSNKEQNHIVEPQISTTNKRKKTIGKVDKAAVEASRELSAQKARIIMLEEQNRDYESTIDLLHQKLSNMRGINNSVQRQDHSVESLNERIQQLETSMTSKLDLLKLELQHQLTVQELNIRHQLEINQLKSKIDQMSYGNQNTSAVPHVPNMQNMQNHSYIPPPPTYIQQPNFIRPNNYYMHQIPRMAYPPYSMSAQHHMNVYYPQHPPINLYHQQAHHQRQGAPTQMPHHATTQSKSQNVNPHQVHSRQTNHVRVKDTTNVGTHISRTKSTNWNLMHQ